MTTTIVGYTTDDGLVPDGARSMIVLWQRYRIPVLLVNTISILLRGGSLARVVDIDRSAPARSVTPRSSIVSKIGSEKGSFFIYSLGYVWISWVLQQQKWRQQKWKKKRQQKWNRHRFQTLLACDRINLTSLIGSIYVESV